MSYPIKVTLVSFHNKNQLTIEVTIKEPKTHILNNRPQKITFERAEEEEDDKFIELLSSMMKKESLDIVLDLIYSKPPLGTMYRTFRHPDQIMVARLLVGIRERTLTTTVISLD